MARKVDAEKHAEVVAAAFEALRRRGVVGVSMADLAGDLGMSRSALYWYFGGLSELFEAVLEQVLARQEAAAARAIFEVEHPIDQIAAWMRATVRQYDEDPDLLAVLLQLWATARPDSKDETLDTFQQRFLPLRALACQALQDGIERGAVAPCDATAIIDLCAVVVDGALVHHVSRRLDAVALVEHFLQHILLPLRREAQPSPTIPRRSAEDWMAWD
jgi:AcrR family transcriptional regulator